MTSALCLTRIQGEGMRRRIVLVALCSVIIIACLGSASYGQDAACTFSVAPETIYFFDVRGGTADVHVKASAPTCTFTAKTEHAWISLLVKQERGEEIVSVTALGNDSMNHRVGSVSVDGKVVTVIQYGPRLSGS